MSFQDVAVRSSGQHRARRHPPKHPRVRDGAVSGASSASARREHVRPARVPSFPRDQNTPSRYLHDDLLNNYRLHLSHSKSSSSFKDAVDSATPRAVDPSHLPVDDAAAENGESRDDSESLGEERLSELPRQPRPAVPKSTFAKMTQETQQFQKLVTDLETILKQAGESPETDWKARILIQSARDTDQGLSEKLQVYETTLLLQNPEGLRTSQKTACGKLQRDFQRSHATLMACLTEYETRQKAEVSQLGATRWSSKTRITATSRTNAADEDYFERTMRQREIERMNTSMRHVNLIYNELAGLVEGQQEKIDRMDREIDDAAVYTEAAADEIHCLSGRRETVLCGAMDGCVDDEENDILLDDSEAKQSPKGLRVAEVFHWYMPFETIQEDLESVKNDIVHVGKEIVSHGKRLKCTSKSSAM